MVSVPRIAADYQVQYLSKEKIKLTQLVKLPTTMAIDGIQKVSNLAIKWCTAVYYSPSQTVASAVDKQFMTHNRVHFHQNKVKGMGGVPAEANRQG